MEKKTLSDYPKLLKQWDFKKNDIDPFNVPARSNKKYYWKCDKCHQSYLASPDKKASRNYGCPICSNHLVIEGVNDFKTNHKELMLDWDYEKNNGVDPAKLSKRSISTVFWKCHRCGFEWSGKIRDATEKSINCPKCSMAEKANQHHLKALSKSGSLQDKKLLADWDYKKNKILPSEVTPQSNKYAYWKCHKCGYEWKAKINNRTNGRGCPLCGNKVVVQGVNDLSTTHPDLAKEWHPTKNGVLTPKDVTYGSGKKVWWLCHNGHEYQATVMHRASSNPTNCPICYSGRQTSFNEQALFFYIKKMFPKTISRYKADFLGKYELDIYIPEIRTAIEYDGIYWHKKEKKTRELIKYKICQENGIYLIRVVEDSSSTLAADYQLSVEGIEKQENFENLIRMIIMNLVNKMGLSILQVDKKYLDVNITRDRYKILDYMIDIKDSFEDLYPELAKEWHQTKNGNLKPSMVKPHSGHLVWWKCSKCGNEFEMTVDHVTNGSGCPICAKQKQINTYRKNVVDKRGHLDDEKLLLDWDYEKNSGINPSNLPKHSTLKVHWKCHKCGHEWEAKISNRVNGRGCPKCAGMLLFPGFNDLKTKNPHNILEEWDYSKNIGIKPEELHYHSTKKVWWKCKVCGYEYLAPVQRRANGSGCRKCADKANKKRT